MGNKPLNERRSAFITMKNFRPMISRVPLGPGGEGMSTKAHLVLDVNTFDVKGAFGEPKWGNPLDIEFSADVKAWVEGLRQGGGAG